MDTIKRRKNGTGAFDKARNIIVLHKPNHPNAYKNGKISEHIFIMSEYLKRPIADYETVIHLDGNTLNNKIENLAIKNITYICKINGCKLQIRALELCHIHYRSFRKYGDPTIVKRNKNGEGTINAYGYRLILKDGSREFEHRTVMENVLGRKLFAHENVHHKNGDRLDNKIENLEIWSSSQPSGQRIIDKINWAREILEIYKDYEINT